QTSKRSSAGSSLRLCACAWPTTTTARRTTRQMTGVIILRVIGADRARLERLLGGLFAGGHGLFRRHCHHVFGPDFARDDRDIDLCERLAVVRVLATDEERRARLERAAAEQGRRGGLE